MAFGRLKPGWYVLAAIGLALLAWSGGPALGRRMSFFRVRRVELVGLRYGTVAATLAGLRLPSRFSAFDDLRPIARRAAALPGVRHAEVSRRLPATLRVELEEAVPVALAPRGDSLTLIDARGRVLPFDPLHSAPDLPVAQTADSLVARLLGRMQDFNPTLFAIVVAAHREQDDVVLNVGGPGLRLRPDASPEEMRAVKAVVDELARKGRRYRELDGRFAGQVILRGGA